MLNKLFNNYLIYLIIKIFIKMKTTIIQIIFLSIFFTNSYAQTRSIEAESSVVTNHFVTVNGNRIPYSATAGTLPVWSEDDKAVATLFYTYYKRTDVKDVKKRPLFISFNGGPGAASIWMHMGYTSPRTLNIDDEEKVSGNIMKSKIFKDSKTCSTVDLTKSEGDYSALLDEIERVIKSL